MTSENRRVISVLVSLVLPTRSGVGPSSLIDAAAASIAKAIPKNAKPERIALGKDDREMCRVLKTMPLLATSIPTLIPTVIPSDILASSDLVGLSAASIKLRPWPLSRNGRLPKLAVGQVSPSWMKSRRSSHNLRNRQWSPSTRQVAWGIKSSSS